MRIGCFVVAVLIMGPFLVSASAAEDSGSQTGQRRDLWKQFDADGDGRLSEAERAKARRAMAGRGGQGNRVRRPAEANRRPAGGRPRSAQLRAQLLRRFDRDGDGQLNEGERAAAMKARPDFMEQRGNRRRFVAPVVTDKPNRSRVDRAELVKKFDTNGDGQLKGSERTAALRAFQNRGR